MSEVETKLPQVFTPEDVAKKFGWSPRKLRAKAREIGACRILGNRMVLLEADVAQILEASRPAVIMPAVKPDRNTDFQELLRLRALNGGR
ncbi:hypothetical protein GOZ90_09600 [Agrobacterium vitis]|uniref:Uncharacterized protein n=1 Tax=Agrobacterium vitis TaxID=373 RepID=A0A6L6VB82_AGRVI|nr:hypothetical protein [Agrobacterium vitis]MUZ72936.1 hypothetical protein [Agrobacterium vitis]